jgi:hypothetical protein
MSALQRGTAQQNRKMSYDGFSIYKIEEMTGINSKPMQ